MADSEAWARLIKLSSPDDIVDISTDSFTIGRSGGKFIHPFNWVGKFIVSYDRCMKTNRLISLNTLFIKLSEVVREEQIIVVITDL